MKKLMLLCLLLGLSGCQSSQATADPKVYSTQGIVVSEPTCEDTVCKAVIKIDEDVWHYDAIKAPVTRGDTIYHACRYEPTREVCSALWTRERDRFYPETTAEGVDPL